jgi:hypothetical protein
MDSSCLSKQEAYEPQQEVACHLLDQTNLSCVPHNTQHRTRIRLESMFRVTSDETTGVRASTHLTFGWFTSRVEV